ncbi:hypothetical protein [Pseudomonas protegens]|uniref:hypothetical protein n=1 Tax=Pseudomonas protegens TaxID=380021 RepID=UPI000E1F78BC|nr:hypothetical protein [Pseudomonas protegens]AXK52504.1 hypothetical protein DWF74_03745 [Pseudomonas protegens]
MHLLYRSDPFDPKRPDEHYLDEYEAVLAAGLNASLFSFEDFESGRFKVSPALPGLIGPIAKTSYAEGVRRTLQAAHKARQP